MLPNCHGLDNNRPSGSGNNAADIDGPCFVSGDRLLNDAFAGDAGIQSWV